MNIRRRLLGPSAIILPSRDSADFDVEVDIDSFIRRLLLFDTYVLYSVRLKEIPALVRLLGYEGLHYLLSSGAVEIRCECAQLAEGQFNTPACPLFTYQFHIIDAHSREQYVIDCLENINQAHWLPESQMLELKSAVVKAIRSPDMKELLRKEVSPTVERELLYDPTLPKQAIVTKLAGIHNVDKLDFEIKVRKVGEGRFAVETDLPRKVGASREEIHNVIKSGLLAIAGLSQRIAEMEAHEALSGFLDEDLPLFREKLRILARLSTSDEQEFHFKRVVSIAGLPRFSDGGELHVNVEKLLKVRSSPEAREFRDWLSGLDSVADEEIRDRVASLNSKLGLLAHGTAGRSMRFMFTTAVGLIPGIGPALGIAAGATDQFLTEKIIRRSGIAAFINELYPSIFEGK